MVVSGLASLVFLVGVVSWWTTCGWVAAGMENAPALCLMVAVAAAFPLLRRSRPWPVVPSMLLGLLATVRVEFAALAAPLFVVFLLEVVASTEQRGELPTPVDASSRRLLHRRVVVGVGPAVGFIGAVHLARRFYFGAWLPNTAVVQDRFSGARQLLVLLWLGVVAIGSTPFTSVDDTRVDRSVRSAPLAGTAWVALCSVALAGVVLDPPRVLDYEVAGYGEIQVAAQQFRNDQLAASSLPIVANPDLGKLSYQKEALMVDLGLLGDPLLATLWKSDRSLAVG